MTQSPLILSLTDCMDMYARLLNNRADETVDKQTLVDTIILADDLRKTATPEKEIIARLRGQAMACGQRRYFLIAAYMDLIADHMDALIKRGTA